MRRNCVTLLGTVRWRQKRSRWQNQGKRKPLLTKMTTSQKSRKVRKTGQSEKGSEEGAASASIAKKVRATRRQSELRYHRDVGHDDPFALQSDPIAAVLAAMPVESTRSQPVTRRLRQRLPGRASRPQSMVALMVTRVEALWSQPAESRWRRAAFGGAQRWVAPSWSWLMIGQAGQPVQATSIAW
jgi:hypothetical protein